MILIAICRYLPSAGARRAHAIMLFVFSPDRTTSYRITSNINILYHEQRITLFNTTTTHNIYWHTIFLLRAMLAYYAAVFFFFRYITLPAVSMLRFRH